MTYVRLVAGSQVLDQADRLGVLLRWHGVVDRWTASIQLLIVNTGGSRRGGGQQWAQGAIRRWHRGVRANYSRGQLASQSAGTDQLTQSKEVGVDLKAVQISKDDH